MNKTIRSILLLSGILPATLLLPTSVMGIFVLSADVFSGFAFRYSEILVLCSLIMGVAGYLGLWRNLIFEDSSSGLNSVLLLAGIAGFVIFIIVEGRGRAITWIFAFEERGEIIAFVWPVIVALAILISDFLTKKVSPNQGLEH